MASPKKTTMAQREPPAETKPGDVPTFKVEVHTESVDGSDEGMEEETEMEGEEASGKKKKGMSKVAWAFGAGVILTLVRKRR